MIAIKEYIEVGKIVSTHGVRGEAKAEHWCDNPDLLLAQTELHVGSVGRIMRVSTSRAHKNMVLIKFFGVDSVEAAAALRGSVMFLHRDKIPLAENEYLIQDLIGLRVLDVDTGECYGTISDVSKTGANDVYHITFPNGSEQLVPVIKDVVKKVDILSGEVLIRPLEGLFS